MVKEADTPVVAERISFSLSPSFSVPSRRDVEIRESDSQVEYEMERLAALIQVRKGNSQVTYSAWSTKDELFIGFSSVSRGYPCWRFQIRISRGKIICRDILDC